MSVYIKVFTKVRRGSEKISCLGESLIGGFLLKCSRKTENFQRKFVKSLWESYAKLLSRYLQMYIDNNKEEIYLFFF